MKLLYLKRAVSLFFLTTLTLAFAACSNISTDSKSRLDFLGRVTMSMNPGSGEIDISYAPRVPRDINDPKRLAGLYNLGWENSLDFAANALRVEPVNCATADYNAASQIFTTSVRLISRTNTGTAICPTGSEEYCGETYMAPLELRIYSFLFDGICDTTIDPTCKDGAAISQGTTEPIVQTHLISMNHNSGCDSLIDSTSNGFWDCFADDPTFTYTAPDYDEYETHATWDYTSKCDVSTDDPAQALDPGESSGCKFLQFTIDHPDLDLTHIPLISVSADILGFVQGAGLDLPLIGSVTTPTRFTTQDIPVTIDTGAGADTIKITGGVSEVTCQDNDAGCDLDMTVGIVEVTVELNTNQQNNLYVYQLDTIAPTNSSSGQLVQITHDDVQPQVSITDPLSDEVNVSPSTNILITFAEPVIASSIDTTSIELYQGGTPISGAVSLSPNGYTATFNPDLALNNNTIYTIQINGGTLPCSDCVKDLASNAMASNYTSNFRTSAGDIIAPIVSSTNPPDNASGVSINSTVQITFNEPIDETSLTSPSDNIIVEDGGVPVSGTISLSVSGLTATFTPDSDFDTLTEYEVTVNSGSNGVKDLAGNPLAVDYLFFFETGAAADSTPPEVVSTIPVNNAVNISEHISPEIAFSEAIDPSTVISDNLFIKKYSDESLVNSTMLLSGDGITVTVNPNSALENGTEYVLTIGEQIEDLAGNGLLTPRTIHFTTAASPDTTAPYVTSTSPSWYEAGVSLYTGITVNFSEKVDPATVSSATITVNERWGGPYVNGTVELADNGMTAYFFQNDPPLDSDTYYELNVLSGASGIKDLAGNNLTAYWTTFMTAPDPVDPFIVGISPADGTTGVPLNTNVVVTFSEPIDESTINDTNFYLHVQGSGTHVPATLTLQSDKIHASLNPDSDLSASSTYELELTTGIQDLGGRSLAASTTDFTTGAIADGDGPVVTHFNSDKQADINGLTNIGRWENLYIVFDEPLDSNTVNISTVEMIRDSDSSKVPVDISLSGDGLTITVDGTTLLDNNTQYTLKAKTGIRNLAGYALQSYSEASFETVDNSSDTTRPTVLLTIPPDSDRKVDRNVTGYVYFSESMNPDQVYDGFISFEMWNGSFYEVVPEVVTLNDSSPGDINHPCERCIATIDPYATLTARTWHRTYIEWNLIDDAGNHLSPGDVVPYWRTDR